MSKNQVWKKAGEVTKEKQLIDNLLHF